MIKTKKIEIKPTNKNIEYYKNLGFNIKTGDTIIINVDQLPTTSKLKIDVECDNCKTINNISYFSYLRNIKNGNYYCKKCSGVRFKETSLIKYGVEHPLKLDKIKNKSKETNIERYGVEFSSQNKDVQNKRKSTNIKKYGNEQFMLTDKFKEKRKITMLEKYDTVIPIQNKKIKDKIEKTCIKKYDAKSPFESEIIKNKCLKIKKERYGDEKYNNRKKYKETCITNFGADNPMKDNNIYQKMINTVFDRYGVYHPAQNIDIYDKMIKSGIKILKYKNTDLYYQGTYELDFLNNYYDKIDIIRGNPIKYYYNDIEYIYYPDFFIKDFNLIVEIKSKYWYNKHLEKNLKKELTCKEYKYNFIFIINKNYDKFKNIINGY